MSIKINGGLIRTTTQTDQNLSTNIITTNSLVVEETATLNNENIATVNYVDSKIQGILGDNVNGLLDTLTEIDQALNSDPDFYNSITNVINTKSSLAGDNTFSGVNNFTNSLQYNGVDIPNRITNNESQIQTTTDNLTSLSDEFNNFKTSGTMGTLTITNSLITESIVDNGNCTIKGNTILGDGIGNDTLTVNSTGTYTQPQTFQNGLTANTINVNNYDLNSKINTLAIDSEVVHKTNVNENISGVKNFFSRPKVIGDDIATVTDLTSKANLSQIVYSKSYKVNSGVNTLSNVLANLQATTDHQSIELSAGSHNDSTDTNITTSNLAIFGPPSAMNSSATLYYPKINISGSAVQRVRFSNIQFQDLITINGTLGKHFFSCCTLSAGITLLNATSNWIQFADCTISTVINVPSTFTGFITFYNCDLSGATLNFLNLSNQQILLKDCVGLGSLNLNATLLGFNNSSNLSSISTYSLNVQGSTSFPSGSINSTSINNTSFVNLAGSQTISGNKSFTNGITTNALTLGSTDLNTRLNTNETNIASNTSSIDTINTTLATKANDNAVVHLTGSETISGVKTFTNGLKSNQTLSSNDNSNNVATTNYVDTAINNLIAGAPSTLDTLSEIATVLQNDTNSINTILSTMVNLSGNQNVSGIKTFTNGAKSNQTLNQDDNSNNLATTAYVDTGLSNKLDKNNPTFTGTLTGQSIVDNGALTASGNVTLNTNNQNTFLVRGVSTFQQNLSVPSITLNGTDVNTRITTNENNILTNTNSIIALNSKTFNQTFNSGLNTTTFSGILATPSILLNGTNLHSRISTIESNVSTNTSNINTNTTNITNNTNSIDILNSKTTDITYNSGTDITNVSGGLTILGNLVSKSISDNGSRVAFDSVINCKNSLQFNGIDITALYQPLLTFDSQPTLNSTNSVRSGGIFSYLQSTFQPISGMSSYLTTSNASSTYQTISGMSSYITQSVLNSALTSYASLSSSNVFSGANSFSGAYTNFSGISENINSSITVSTNTLNINFNSNTQSTYNITPSSSSNMIVNFLNIPTSNTNCSYTYTFLINVSTNKSYITVVNVNGNTVTNLWGGGSSAQSVNASATRAIQQISICFLNSSTPIAISNLVSLW